MPELEDVLSLVGEIYDAAVDPSLWPRALDRIRLFVPGDLCMLISEDAFSSRGKVHYASREEPEWMRAYFDKYIYLNPVLVPAILNTKVGDIISAWTYVPYEEYEKSQFHREWVSAKDYVDVVSSVLEKSPTSHAVLTVLRHRDQGLADAEAYRRVNLIAPHVRRAVAISRMIELKTIESEFLKETLDGLPAAILLVGHDARIHVANASARARLEATTLLAEVKGALAVRDADGQQAVRAAIAAAAQGDKALGTSGITIPLKDQSNERFVATVLPLTSGARRGLSASYNADAAIFIRKAELEMTSPLAALAEAYGLTQREISVLMAVVEVGGVPAVAAMLGLSNGTVKTYLKSIFRKTGARRQADLIKLVAGMANPFANPTKPRQ
jgi:DNA-binding NarL/FixJ family response regulator